MNVAALLRDERPSGDWSITTTLSTCDAPRRLECGAGLGPPCPKRRCSAGANVSLIRLLLPEPLTPVTQQKTPRGNIAETFFKLLAVAPSSAIERVLATRRRCAGTSICDWP